MTLAEVVLIGLAVWRVAWMLVKEDGPYQVFKRLRARTTLGGLLACVHCMSVWLALPAYVLYQQVPFLILICSISGVASVVQHWLGLDFRE